MEAYLFIYSRLERFDYRLIYAPSQSFLPSPTRDEFVSFAREVINTDNVANGGINTARWSVIKRGNKVLFGVGMYNKDLGDCSSTIETRDVRGFFGIVFNYEGGGLPNDIFTISYFQNLYASYFMPIWHTVKKDEYKINSIIQGIKIIIQNNNLNEPILLNAHASICKILPESILVSDAINSALQIDDVELVLGLNDVKHVTSARLLQFRNVSIIGNITEEVINITPKKSSETSFKSKESKIYTGGQPMRKIKNKEDSPHHITPKPEISDHKDMADAIFSKLRRCGFNVKRIVIYLAQKCGLRVIEQSDVVPTNQPFGANVGTFVGTQKEIDDNVTESSPETKAREKEERRTRLTEIRKKLSDIDDIPEGHCPQKDVTGLHIDINNIEEINNLPKTNKENLDIEELK